jgi:hypothetical protein
MRKDILLVDNDLQIDGEDFLLGNSDNQYVQDIIEAEKGWYKLSPFLGVGVMKYLNSAIDINTISKEIKKELESDGYKNPLIKIDSEGKITVGV